MKQMIFRVLLFACVFLPMTVSAHSFGASLERIVGEYAIDIGYDPPVLVGGDRVVFDFNLLMPVASTSVPFDYVWVRLRTEGQALLSTGVHRADLGPTSLLLELPEETKGDLEVYVRFQKEDETLAEADFVIPVSPYEDPEWWHRYAIALAALAAGLLGGASALYGWNQWRGHADVRAD
jgi:hypothetical protein